MLNRPMAPQLPPDGFVLGLDVGERRIGAALAGTVARLPRPIDVIDGGEKAFDSVSSLVKSEDVRIIVVGIPRNLDGEETAQSRSIREFADKLEKTVGLPVVFADESMSSVRADELAASNAYPGASQDSLAACFILEEFFGSMNTAKEGAV